MKPLNKSVRWWLMQNGYEDVAQKIEEFIKKWQKEGKKTRRNWWDILAGDKKGNPRKIEGVEMPVIKAAQIRMGVSTSKNAVKRNRKESKAPSVLPSGRWPTKKK